MRCSTIQLIHVCRNWEPDPLLQLPKEAQPRTLDFAFHYDLKAVDSSCTYFFSTMSSYPSISLSCPILHIQAAGGCSKPRTQDGKVTNSELLQLDATSASGRIKGSSSHLSDLQQPSSHRLAGAWDRILLSLVGFVVQVLGSILSPSQCLLSTGQDLELFPFWGMPVLRTRPHFCRLLRPLHSISCSFPSSSNQSILKEISPGCSLEGLMLKLKLQYFGHLMRRADSLEKTLMLGGIGSRRRRGRPRMRWLDGITDSMHMSLKWTPGVDDGQGGLACCDSWGCKELDMTEWLNWLWEPDGSKVDTRKFFQARGTLFFLVSVLIPHLADVTQP